MKNQMPAVQKAAMAVSMTARKKVTEWVKTNSRMLKAQKQKWLNIWVIT